MAEATTNTREGTSTWTIDPAHSEVAFGVRHMMISTVKGHFTGTQGTIVLDEEDLSGSHVDVEIEAASIDTRNADRDQHLRSADFFDVENHPTIRFRGREVEGTPDEFRLEGDLTIRGETRPVVLEGETLGTGTDPWGGERMAFRAEGRINRKDFGLTWNQALEAGGVLVGDEIKLALEIQAVRADEEENDDG